MSVARLVEGEHSVSTNCSLLTNGKRFSDRWLSRYRFSSYQETILKKRIVARTASLALIGAGLIAISLAILLPAAVTFAQTVSFGAATDVAVGTGPSSVASGDLNGDGKPDLVVANAGSNDVSILFGTGGAFSAQPAVAVGTNPRSVAIRDLDRDGKPDLVVANNGSGDVSILLGTGGGAFGVASPFGVGVNPVSVAIGDLNGDGKPDLAVANNGSNDVSILLGTGTGAFGAAAPFGVGVNPVSVAIGDLNGDGKPDLVVANDSSNDVSILLGTGTGAFSPATTVAVGTGPSSVAIGDLNGDGKPDLATANYFSGTVSILRGAGGGAFGAATTVAVGLNPVSVVIGDLNGDGKPDLAVANSGSGTVSVLLNTTLYFPSGVFGAVTSVAVGAAGPVFVVMGDLNGDGKPDLAVANYFSPTVSILLGTGTGAFSAATNFGVGENAFSVAMGDLNGDGKPDLAVANSGSNTVSILLGTGTGAFGAATNIAVGWNPRSVAIGDLNRDGKPDLAVANYYSHTVSVLLGTGGGTFSAGPVVSVGSYPHSVAMGDLDGDGKPDLATANTGSYTVSILLGDGTGAFGTVTTVAVGAGPVAVAMGDLNGDGKPDLATANYFSTTVSILLGTGGGTFSAAPAVAVGPNPYSVAIGDLNGDGKPDLAASTHSLSSFTVSTHHGTGTGAFVAATTVALGQWPHAVAIGDLNGDGKPDLAVAIEGSNAVSILLNSPYPDLSVTKTDSPDSVPVGADLTYTMTVTNSGSLNATGVTLTDTLPPDTTILSITPSQGTCSSAGLVVTCLLGSLNNGSSATVTIVVWPNSTGTLTNTASVTGSQSDLNTANNTATATTTVVAASADLSLTKTDSPDPVAVGNSLSYTLVVTNNGPSRANGVTLTDPLPGGVTFVYASSTQGSCSEAGGTVTCPIGQVGHGMSETVTMVVTPTGTGTLTNTASVASTESDPVPGNNSVTITTTVNPPADNTPAGNNVAVPLGNGVTLTFSSVTSPGETTINITTTGPPPPTGFLLGSPAIDYDVNTTAAFSGSVTICITYIDSQFLREGSLELFHFEGSAWQNVTTSLNTSTNVICGTTTSLSPFVIVEPDIADLINISTRAYVGTGSNATVGGFIISGSGTKQVLIRGFGPTLTSFGVTGALANPTLELSWDDDSNPLTPPLQLALNDNWGTSVTVCTAPVVSCGTPQDITNTGMSADTYAPTNPNRGLDAALLVTLPPGLYTVSLSGVSNGTGVGLIGVDDVDTNQTATLVNISARAFVGTGTNAAVGGFIISGTAPKQVLIRGFGPTLSSFGVSGALANPTVELSWDDDSNPLTAPLQLAVNNNWGTAAAPCNAPVVACGTPLDIANTGMSADTYAPTNPNRGLDAALLVTLPPGLYTVALSGVSNGTGVGLIGVDAIGP